MKPSSSRSSAYWTVSALRAALEILYAGTRTDLKAGSGANWMEAKIEELDSQRRSTVIVSNGELLHCDDFLQVAFLQQGQESARDRMNT